MKRFAALTTRAALVGALLGVGSVSHAASNTLNMYLVPISPLNATYHAGDTIQFAALVDVPATGPGPITLTLGAAVGYDVSVFDINGIFGTVDTSAFPPKPANKLWDLVPPTAYSMTFSGLDTFQLGVGHTKQVLQPGNKTVTIPGGTYTIGTYSFPVLKTIDAAHTTDIILPTALGLDGPNSAKDFINNTDSAGTNDEVLAFPNDGVTKFNKLTYGGGGANTATAIFHITFQGLANNGPAQSVTVRFHPTDNSGDITKTGTASQTVVFSASVPFNTYDIYIKSPKYLGVLLHDVSLIDTTQQNETVTLLAGDANNDNIVDSGDFGLLVNAYGSRINDGTGQYNLNADFNSDGFVDILDFNLLVESYTLTGY